MNNVKMLPDAYAKSETSNNYKLLQLAYLLYYDMQSDFESIMESRDIQKATGETLDNYGEMIGQSRNGDTDEQYRVKIMNKIARTISGCDVNSFINAVSQMLDIDSSTIHVVEGDMNAAVYGISSDVIEASGLTSGEITSMIESVLPVGVGLVRPSYKGTLLVTSNSDASVEDYPVLFQAWKEGQEEYLLGNDVGISGYGEVPDSFVELCPSYNKTGTYSGGTLGVLSGD